MKTGQTHKTVNTGSTICAVVSVASMLLLAGGCAGATGIDAMATGDPVATGLGCVAAAIVTHGILQIIFRD